MSEQHSNEQQIRPAATLIVLREQAGALEVLLLRRHSASRVGSGAWVFPGGVVEPVDREGAVDPEAAARRAASREATEEAGIKIPVDAMQLISHWTTPKAPEVSTKRFATWFFLAACQGESIQVDGEEIDDYRWASPGQVIVEHQSGELKLMPPQLVTLTELQACASIETARRFYAEREVPYIEPRLTTSSTDRICMLYAGDAGYEACNAEVEGARNRCWLEPGYWRYEFSA